MLAVLDLKMWRDLSRMKGQLAAVSLVMACGLAMMIMMNSLVYSLSNARDEYYQKYRFGDVFADLKRAPNSLRERLAEIPGVTAVETRVNGRIILDLPGMVEPADGVILSLPDDRPQQLHLLHLRRGRLPSTEGRREVVVGEAFANAHGFSPGDTLTVIMHGARETLKIVGIALSPEFVFEARPGNTLPDNKRFGVFWMNERELAEAFELDGAFNNVVLDLAPGENTAPVMAEVDRILAPYGGRVAYDRRDHASNVRLDDEIRVLSALSLAFPTVFLSIAAFMSSAVLTRVVRLQREQIAQLKALGYSSWQVGAHYLKFALVIVALGLALGCVGGFWLGSKIVVLWHRFFQFPSLIFQPAYWSVAAGAVASAVAAILGVMGAVRQAVKLPPAEAMRPEPPAVYRRSWLERLGLQHVAGPTLRMALRNLERRPWQSFFSALGLALATGIPIIPGAMRDGINYILEFQWDSAQRQHATLSFIEPSSSAIAHDVSHLPGVLMAESFRSVPARLRYGHRSRRLSIHGLPPGTQLNRLLGTNETPILLPPYGVVLSAKLAEILGAQRGDLVRLEVQEGRRPVLEVPIHDLLTDYAGVAAYMDITALQRLMQEGNALSGAHVFVDPAQWPDFMAAVKESPSIASLMVKNATRQSFRQSTAEMIGLIQRLYFAFAIIVSFGVVYNSARIALSERGRELATLRVVGFSHREVAAVLISELSILTLIALPAGLLIGSGLANLIIQTASTETVRLPLVLTAKSYATAVLIVLSSSSLSFALVSRGLQQLDLLGVLKSRD